MSAVQVSAPPAMPAVAEEVVFDSSLESVFKRALGRRMTSRCKQRLKAAGLDLDVKLHPSYPRLKFYEFLNVAADELYPGIPREQALFELGREFLNSYDQTVIGKAVLAMVRLLGPKKTILRASQNMQSSNNYMKTSAKELAPGQYELWLSQVSGAPRYFEGVVFAGLTLAGAKELSVKVVAREGDSATYRCGWAEK